MLKQRGAIDPISIAIIVVCFAAGGYYFFGSKEIDSPIEEMAESILDAQGIDVDFSAGKKAKR